MSNQQDPVFLDHTLTEQLLSAVLFCVDALEQVFLMQIFWITLISGNSHRILWLKAWSAEAWPQNAAHLCPSKEEISFVKHFTSSLKMLQEQRFFFPSGKFKNPFPKEPLPPQHTEHLNTPIQSAIYSIFWAKGIHIESAVPECTVYLFLTKLPLKSHENTLFAFYQQ